MRSSTRLLAAALAAATLGLTGCSSLEGTGDKNYVAGGGSVREVGTADRGDPVSLTGTDLDGKPLDLSDLRGKPTVVNVWGAWCTDCRSEAPDLVAARKEIGEKANFVGIDVRDGSTAQAKSYVRTFGVDYPSFYSPDSKALLQFTGTLSPNAIPSTVVLDAEGRIAASIIGSIPSTQTLVDVVQDVVDGKSEDIGG